MHNALGVHISQLTAVCGVAVWLAVAHADWVEVQLGLSKPHADRLRAKVGLSKPHAERLQAKLGLTHAAAPIFWFEPESEPPGPVLQLGAHCVYSNRLLAY